MGRYSVILFKSCARCGGDVDATFESDVYCVQCGHRPAVPPLAHLPAPWAPRPSAWCPGCRSDRTVRLDRLHEADHACYRCRICGHIFSPRESEPRHAAS